MKRLTDNFNHFGEYVFNLFIRSKSQMKVFLIKFQTGKV